MRAWLCLLLLMPSGAFAAGLVSVDREIAVKVIVAGDTVFLSSLVPIEKGYTTFFALDPDSELPEVDGGLHEKIVTVRARFYDGTRTNGRFRYGHATVFGIRLPIGVREGGDNFASAWWRELALIEPTDAGFAARVLEYRRFLSDGQTLARLQHSKSAARAILKIRKLVLFHLLISNHPKLAASLQEPSVQLFLESAAALWARGTHGAFTSLVRVVEDALDPLVIQDFTCAELLARSLMAEDDLLERKHDLVLSLQGVKKLLYQREREKKQAYESGKALHERRAPELAIRTK